MENLIDLINSEFAKADYEPLTDRLWKHREFDDFWMICTICGDYNVDELQEKVYNNLEPLRKDFPESEKSTSLLILQNLDDVAQHNYQKVIDDENNIYFFKKYVIQYTDDEWDAAHSLIAQGFNGLGELLMKTEVFEQVKLHENSPYHLLYTIAHKLPFVMMHVERKEYDPNPTIIINEELQSLFNWIEELPDMVGRYLDNAEIETAQNAIDQWINNNNHEQH